MSAIAQLQPESSIAHEELTTSEWARLLVMAGVSRNDGAARRIVRAEATATRMVMGNGGLTKVISFSALPAHWQPALTKLLGERSADTFTGLLSVPKPDWKAPVAVEKIKSAAARDEALHRRDSMARYFQIVDNGGTTKAAVLEAQHTYERLTGERVSARTVAYWVKRVREAIGPCGKFEAAPLEAFCRWNEREHEGMQLHNRLRTHVPQGVNPRTYNFDTFLTHFRAMLTEPGMELVSSAMNRLDMQFRSGAFIPGLGVSTLPGLPLPFTYDQLNKFAQGKAERVLAARGKFAALANGHLARLRLNSSGAPILREVQFDDTRCDFVVKREQDGKPVTMKLYLGIETTCRLIPAWCALRGSFTAADTGCLLAGTAMNLGLPHPDAGYACTYKLERGVVAMPPERAKLLEGMFPGRLKIERTGMIGGANLKGDFTQSNSGAFWHKGIVEAFNKAFGFLTRWIVGQRGSDWRKQPAMLGSQGESGDGTLAFSPRSQLALAVQAAEAAHLVSVLNGQFDLDAAAEEQHLGMDATLLYERDAIAAIAAVIEWWNNAIRPHRLEGDWKDVAVEKPGGGRRFYKESPMMKYRRLFGECGDLQPQQVSREHAALFLLRAEKLTVTPEGLFRRVKGVLRQYASPASATGGAMCEVASLATKRRDYLVLTCDAPDAAGECVWLLANDVRDLRADGTVANPAVLEALPLVEEPDRHNPAAVKAAADNLTRPAADQVMYSLARNSAPRLAKQDTQKVNNVRKLLAGLGVAPEKMEQAASALGSLLTSKRAEAEASGKMQPSTKPSGDIPTEAVEVTPPDEATTSRRKAAEAAMEKLNEAIAAIQAATGSDVGDLAETDF